MEGSISNDINYIFKKENAYELLLAQEKKFSWWKILSYCFLVATKLEEAVENPGSYVVVANLKQIRTNPGFFPMKL